MSEYEKTVYILGAGFSADAGIPLQRAIVSDLFALEPIEVSENVRAAFVEKRDRLLDFMEKVLSCYNKTHLNVTLEDVFTPLDRAIVENVSFRGLSVSELLQIRQTLCDLIILLLDHRARGAIAPYVERFAQHLVEIKNKRSFRGDPFSILSLNWDATLDKALYYAIRMTKKGILDYCCDILPYLKDCRIIPKHMARAERKFNLKLYKLHGSMNWLRCPRCQRLFAVFQEGIATKPIFGLPRCRFCIKNFKETEGSRAHGLLISDLKMPTYLKDIGDPQFKLLWHKAGIELAEATCIVFLGYSFPHADYEFRYLLSSFVRKNALIQVVLHKTDQPTALPGTNREHHLPEYRYRAFFGNRKIIFNYDGVQAYVAGLPEQKPKPPSPADGKEAAAESLY